MPEPFLKWAGGKRWLVARYPDLFKGIEFGRYFEPFLGSGAVFFYLQADNAFLSDINPDLIETYEAIRDMPREVISFLPLSLAERAAKFIYLNRTCWNGLYRVNLRGQFNVPVGTKKNVILDTDDFYGVSELLKKATIKPLDFEVSIDQAHGNDFVFVDPPYTVCHNNNGFLKYNENIFSWEDQIRLRNCVATAHDRGVRVVVLNAYSESVIELYRKFPRLIKLDRSSTLSGKAEKRRKIEELAVLTWNDR